MNRWLLSMSLAAVVLSGVGCERDYYANRLIKQDTGYGKLGLTLTGTGEQLLKQKRIDAHRRISVPDKTIIDVWVINARNVEGAPAGDMPTVVILHGLAESKASYLGLGQRLAKMGYNVVLPDLRAHGRSTGKYVTYGALEKHDIKAVVDELVREGLVGPTVYVFGVSLGAATGIQYAAIDPRCKGVMAMAPPKDARSFTKRSMALIAPTMSIEDFEATLARAGQIAKFDPDDASALEAAKSLSCPLLLVHGLLDMMVPAEDSRQIYEQANEPKQLIIVPWSGHAATLLLAREAWIAEQIDLIATTGLKTKAPQPKKAQ